MLLAAFLLSIMALLVKLTNGRIPVFEVVVRLRSAERSRAECITDRSFGQCRRQCARQSAAY